METSLNTEENFCYRAQRAKSLGGIDIRPSIQQWKLRCLLSLRPDAKADDRKHHLSIG